MSVKRLPELDIIRGIAILCILLLNIRIFALGIYAYSLPLNVGAEHLSDQLVFYLMDIFFNGKFIAIFCLLFGMSLVILANHYADQSRTRLMSKRMLGLLLIGLAHGYLLFSGDILVSYAICGMIAFGCYRWSAKKLMGVGSFLYCVAFLIHLYYFFHANNMNDYWRVSPSVLAILSHGYLGTVIDQIKIRAPSTFYVQTTLFIKDYGWRTLGLMLVGMGIYKQELLFRVKRWPMVIMLCMICIGLSCVITVLNMHWDWNARDTQFLGLPLLYLISFPQAILYMLLIALLYRRFSQVKFFLCLADVGKMSLTVYILESLLADFIFCGSGLGYYGRFTYAEQLPMVVAIWFVIFLFSHYWMRYFQRGPIEMMLNLKYTQEKSVLRR